MPRRKQGPGSLPGPSLSAGLSIDSDTAPIFTVGQVSMILDVQPAFLRRLDAEQVVQPARSDGGQRRYSREDIALVQRTVGLMGEGMTLAGIVRIFELEAEIRHLRSELAEARSKVLIREARVRPSN